MRCIVGQFGAACLISRPSWRIQRASGNQGNAPAAVGNTSETSMPLERATMPLERVHGPGGMETPPRLRNGRESSLARVASAENSENGAADCGKLSRSPGKHLCGRCVSRLQDSGEQGRSSLHRGGGSIAARGGYTRAPQVSRKSIAVQEHRRFWKKRDFEP